jgi:YidC/Oxa1 family membrane protein insertase
MTNDQKNLFAAMGLSLAVIVGWQYFYAGPKLEKARDTIAQTQNQAAPAAPNGSPAQAPASPAATPQTPGAAPVAGGAETPAAATRESALAASPRVKIDTVDLSGSIALKGGRIDDLALKQYHESVDPGSPIIELLSPAGSPEPYYTDTGFVAQPGSPLATPKAETVWTADSDTLTSAKPVTLTWDNGAGAVFRRVISVDDQYMFTVKDSVENKSDAPLTVFPYALAARRGKPATSGYAVLHEGFLGVVGNSRVQEITYDGIEKETNAARLLDGTGGWLGITDKYWAVAVVPDQTKAYKARFSSTGAGVKTYQSDLLEEAATVAPGATTEATTRIFAGAKEVKIIETYRDAFGIKNFELMIDWGWFWFITQPMFKLIDLIFKVVGNFGLAILATTVLVKAVLFPLATMQARSMARMKVVAPLQQAIKDRWPDDRQKQQQETMELYKREGINPVAGCLPVLPQIPIFFSLYKVFFITIEMRHAPFYGWIKDLSAPDPTNIFTLFGLIPFDPTQLPLFGSFLHLGVWPLILGVTMFIQMKMNPEPTDPVQKQMFTYMPIIFTFMMSALPAGLVIYYSWNNTLTMLQQGVIMKRMGVKIELFDNFRKMFGKAPATTSK